MTHWEFTLEDVIVAAQSKSLPAMIAKYSFISSYWEFRSYKAQFLPSLNLNAGLGQYNRSLVPLQDAETGETHYVQNDNMNNWLQLSIDQNIPWTGGIISLNTYLNRFDQFSPYGSMTWNSNPVNVYLQQPIFQYNRLKWERKTEPKKYERSKKKYLEDLEDIAITATTYFFTVLRTQESLEMARRRYENTRQLYDIAQAKRRIGHISEIDLMQLKQSALQAEGKVTEAVSNFNSMMFRLRSFLGLGEQDVIHPSMPETATDVRLRYGQVLEKAQANNAFAKNILRRRYEADYAVATAKGERFGINLFASVGYTGKDVDIAGAYNPLKDNQIVEVGFTIPLLDWGKRKGKVKVAESNREVELSKIRQEELDFNQNIFLLVENFNNQAAQLEIASVVDTLAERRYHTSIETFMVGQIDILELNDAQSSKDNARQKHIEELYYYWYYFYNIRSLTLYDFINNRTLDAEFEKLIKQ